MTQFSLNPTPLGLSPSARSKAASVKVTGDLPAAGRSGQLSVLTDCQHHAAQLVTLLLEAHSALDFQGATLPWFSSSSSPQTLNTTAMKVSFLERFLSKKTHSFGDLSQFHDLYITHHLR